MPAPAASERRSMSVRLPRPMCERIDRFIRAHDELGYDDLDEFVLSAVRDKMGHYGMGRKEKGERPVRGRASCRP